MPPFVRAAWEVSPQVDGYQHQFEAKLANGEEAADDFLNRNLPTLQAMEGFYTALETSARTGRAWTSYAILISQSETQDSIGPARCS